MAGVDFTGAGRIFVGAGAGACAAGKIFWGVWANADAAMLKPTTVAVVVPIKRLKIIDALSD